jgi:Protein of unknown function (DUF3082)
MKQVIVGLGSLATGVFGMTAVGMALLGGRVLAGVLSGELSPAADADTSSSISKDSPEAGVLSAESLLAKASAEMADELQEQRKAKQARSSTSSSSRNSSSSSGATSAEPLLKSADQLLAQANADIAAALQQKKQKQ